MIIFLRHSLSWLIATACLTGLGRAAEPPTQAVVDHAVAVYERAWKEADPVKREACLEEIWAEEGLFRDPNNVIRGRVALSAMIGKFWHDFPGTMAERTSRTDFFGTSFRFNWRMVLPGPMVLEGCDIGELQADGRIVAITSFWGPLPATRVEANQAVIRTYLNTLFKQFDYAVLDRIIAKDAVYTQAAGLPYGGRYVGLPEWTKMFTQTQAYYTQVEIVGDPVFFVDAGGDKILANFQARFHLKNSGREVMQSIAELFEMKDGLIVGITPHYFDTKSLVELLAAIPAGAAPAGSGN